MSIFQIFTRLFGGDEKTPQPAPQPVPQPAPKPTPVPKPPEPRTTPAGLRTVNMRGSDHTSFAIPKEADIAVNLSDCSRLQELSGPIRTGSLSLARCTALRTLPANIDVAFLDLSGCTALETLPDDLRLRGGALNLSGCSALTALPENLGEVATLDLSGCKAITEIPRGLIITSWIEISGSGITELPELFDPVGIRLNGVAVSRELAFAPKPVTVEDIAPVPNWAHDN